LREIFREMRNRKKFQKQKMCALTLGLSLSLSLSLSAALSLEFIDLCYWNFWERTHRYEIRTRIRNVAYLHIDKQSLMLNVDDYDFDATKNRIISTTLRMPFSSGHFAHSFSLLSINFNMWIPKPELMVIKMNKLQERMRFSAEIQRYTDTRYMTKLC